MPIYDYVCRSCGHVLEVIHGVNEAGPSVCPACGGEMRRALSAPAIVFKGSGWAKKERTSKASASASRDVESEKPATTEKPGAGSAAKESTAKSPPATSSEAS